MSRASGPVGHNLKNELTWNIQALLPFVTQINDFIQIKKRCERAFLCGVSTEVKTILKEYEERFGLSLWLVETTINYFQTYHKHQDQRAYGRGHAGSSLSGSALSDRLKPK